MKAYKVEEQVIIRPDVEIGNGSVIKCGSILATGTKIGKDCFLGAGVITLVGKPDGTLEPCEIGNNVYIGGGSIINPGVKICDDVIIGSGSVVVKDITEPGTYVGSPVRKIK